MAGFWQAHHKTSFIAVIQVAHIVSPDTPPSVNWLSQAAAGKHRRALYSKSNLQDKTLASRAC
jgi:hypothetical protein